MTATLDTRAPLVVVMGATGCGKSTVGAALAERLRVPFQDADDLHPAANVAKMSRGIPLDDADRHPWLVTVGEELQGRERTGLVVACSALTVAYRDILRSRAPRAYFVHLDVAKSVIASRMVTRLDHFMPLSLLDSQIAALEPLSPAEHGLTVDATQRVDRIVATAADAVRSAVTPLEHA